MKKARRLIKKVLVIAVVLVVVVGAYAGYALASLPDVSGLEKTNPTVTAMMQQRASEKGTEARPIRSWSSYNSISLHLRNAVLVAEDGAFFQHSGYDMHEIREAVKKDWEEGRFARGASTITQQLAKNLYLSTSKNPLRKISEFFIARDLEKHLTKQRIFEIYLNVIEWGDGIWGAEAASRAYFRTPASSLSREQAALLAGAIINPRALNPARPTRRLVNRQRIVLSRMGEVTPPAPVPVLASAPEVVEEGEPLAEPLPSPNLDELPPADDLPVEPVPAPAELPQPDAPPPS